MSKVQNFKKNFWKRGVSTAIATLSEDGSKHSLMLYSYSRKLVRSKTIPCYQLDKELRGLGFKI